MQLPTTPLKSLQRCANPQCRHQRADHLIRCIIEIVPGRAWCICDEFIPPEPGGTDDNPDASRRAG
jgi:hypothetical protein